MPVIRGAGMRKEIFFSELANVIYYGDGHGLYVDKDKQKKSSLVTCICDPLHYMQLKLDLDECERIQCVTVTENIRATRR